MSSKGKDFEAKVCKHLEENNWEIWERNWHSQFGEIDIIAVDPDDFLVFIEVRARTHPDFGGAKGSVGKSKQEKIIRTSKAYLSFHDLTGVSVRYDVFAFSEKGFEHIKGAFSV